MRRFRIRVVLLSLGVVLGYGSAIGRAWYGHGWYDHHHGHRHDGCRDQGPDHDRDPARGSDAPPAASPRPGAPPA